MGLHVVQLLVPVFVLLPPGSSSKHSRRSYIYERHKPIPKTTLGGFQPYVAAFFCGCVVLPLRYLHYISVAYRDLKPENLLLAQDGYLKVKYDTGTVTLCINNINSGLTSDCSVQCCSSRLLLLTICEVG